MEPFEKHLFFEAKKITPEKVYLLVPDQRRQKGSVYLVFVTKKEE